MIPTTGFRTMIATRPRRLRVARGGPRFVMAIGALVFALVAACGDQKAPVDNRQINLKAVVIPVEGMSCIACVASVKKTLTAIAGVGEVEVSLTERNVRVHFDPSRLAPARLVAEINALGYHAGIPTEAR